MEEFVLSDPTLEFECLYDPAQNPRAREEVEQAHLWDNVEHDPKWFKITPTYAGELLGKIYGAEVPGEALQQIMDGADSPFTPLGYKVRMVR